MRTHTKFCVTLAIVLGLAAGHAMSQTKAKPKLDRFPISDDAPALLAKLLGEAPKAASADQWQAVFAKVLDALMTDLGGDDPATKLTAQRILEKLIMNAARPGAEDERAGASKAMAAKLTPDTPADARTCLIYYLKLIGRDEAVDALAGLLADKDAQIAESARQALENCPTDKAGAVLRSALDKASTPAAKVAFINSLAARKDAAAVASIAKLLADKEAAVVSAAARALGKIGGPDAVKALAAARSSAPAALRADLDDAYLQVAGLLLDGGQKDQAAAIYSEFYAPAQPTRVRIAALGGLVRSAPEKAASILGEAITGPDAKIQPIAVRLASELQGPQATKMLADLMPKVAPPVQAALLVAMGSRGDATVKPAVLEAAKSDDEAVRMAAYQALGSLGGAAEVGMLIKAAAGQGPEAAVAREAVAALGGGPAVDSAICKLLSDADVKICSEAIRALRSRKAAGAAPTLLAIAQGTNENLQCDALDALGTLGMADQLQPVVDIIVKAKSNRLRDAAGRAAASICGRMDNRDACADIVLAAAKSADMAARWSLIGVLSFAGGDKALAAVREALKDDKKEIKEAAVRALAGWRDSAASADLLAVAKDPSFKTAMQILALQGYIRLVNSPAERPVAEKLSMYAVAMALAKRPDEKRMVVSPLASLKVLGSLKLVIPCLDIPGVQEEASSAAVAIAGALGDAAASREDVRLAMEKVLAVCRNKKVHGEAQRILGEVNKAGKK